MNRPRIHVRDLYNYVINSCVTAASLVQSLASYVTSSSLATTLLNYVTSTSLSTILSNYAPIASPTFTGTVTAPQVKLTPEGGVAQKYKNKTGGASVKGTVVNIYNASAIDNAVSKIVVDVPDAIGVIYDDGVQDGDDVWVVTSGKAHVLFVGNTTRKHLARTFISADGGSYISGYALSEAFPSSPFATDKHFCEIGHVCESRVGAGLALVNLHFN